MLATDFHIVERKMSIGYSQRKSQCKSLGVQNAIPFSYFCEDVWLYLMI